MKISEIVEQLGGQWQGEDVAVDGVQTLAAAQTCHVAFLANLKYRHQLKDTQAGVIIVKDDSQGLPENHNYILAEDPYLYFAQVSRIFHPRVTARPTRHATAVIDDTASVPNSCEIGAHVVIGKNVRIGERCRLLSGCVIEDGCILGDDCTIHTNAVLYYDVRLGDRVTIHACSAIGADGFGNACNHQKLEWYSIPQSGSGVIGSDTEIGANSNIDRGALDNTIIGEGVRIDNQVQIGHNCVIGNHTAIAACTGISGSTHIGNYCIIGGAVMFAGHLTIADGTMIGGGTAVFSSITEPAHYASVFPLQTRKEWGRTAVHIRHLNDLNQRVKDLEKMLSMRS